jgi:NADP-dependent 3-hydroxy acid dehydrogenase YdfG
MVQKTDSELQRETTNRLAVVTGATSGIGRGIAAHFSKRACAWSASTSGRRRRSTLTVGLAFLVT